MKRLLAGMILLGLAVPAWAAQPYCGVDPPNNVLAALEEAYARQLKAIPRSPLPKAVDIPISLNMITNGRQGNYSDAVLVVMLNNLNWGFRDTPFRFHFAKVRRVNNKKWFQNCAFGTANHVAMTKKLALDPHYYLNIYTCFMGDPNLLGLGSLPIFPFPSTDKRQSVLINPLALPHGQGDLRYSYYGLTTVHEVGHYLGLWHTFQGECLDQDEVADTPAQGGPTRYCPAERIDTCPANPGADDVWNFMNYAEDTCWDHFTPGQISRMIGMVQTYRPWLVQ